MSVNIQSLLKIVNEIFGFFIALIDSGVFDPTKILDALGLI